MTVATSKRKVFARHGARALENAGPLQELKAMLFRHMKPWRPTHVLHVALVLPEKEDLYYERWGRPKSGILTAAPKQRVCTRMDLNEHIHLLRGIK
jgi:hypothetical protein